jgi:Flp pilus assembly pilin Flp
MKWISRLSRRVGVTKDPAMGELHQSSHSQRGQGMTEYIVIVALVGVAAIGVYSLLGQTIRNQTVGLAEEISGNVNSGIAKAQGSASTAAGISDNKKGLGTYNADQNR